MSAFKTKFNFLEHIVSNKGVKKEPEKSAAASKIKSPQLMKKLKAILGPAGFYRRLIQFFGKIADSFYKLLKK